MRTQNEILSEHQQRQPEGPLGPKFLVLRFSSIGDVTQALSIPTKIAEKFSSHDSVEIHFAVRDDIAEILEGHPHISKIWQLPRRQGFRGLWQLLQSLRQEKFTHIYDAHNSVRSRFLCLFLCFPFDFRRFLNSPKILRKSRKRWKRFLLFQLRKDTYRKPLSGQRDLLEPLAGWYIDESLPPPPQMVISADQLRRFREKLPASTPRQFICLAPSAAFELKRWPLEFFIEVVKAFPQRHFLLLGGPQDDFIRKITETCPQNTTYLVGQLSLGESAAAISASQGLVANDTGLLHFAEQLGIRAVALMGPAPFGFPSRPLTHILERSLPCRPCSKHGQGPCINPQYQLCLKDIKPSEVCEVLSKWPY